MAKPGEARYVVRVHFQSWKVGEVDEEGDQIYMNETDSLWDGHSYNTMTVQSIEVIKAFAGMIEELGAAGMKMKEIANE